MKIRSLLLVIAVATPAFAAQDRCSHQQFTMRDSYNILHWAMQCGKGVNANNQIIFNAYWAQANATTRNGTYFPPEGSAEYENSRDGVSFPTYFVPGSQTDFWRGPNDGPSLARIAALDCSLQIPAQYSDWTFCKSGCYAPNQYILFSDQGGASQTSEETWIPVAEAFDVKKHVVTLTADAALDSLKYGSSEIDYFIADPKPVQQNLLHFTMASGGELTVTRNHPVVDSTGTMRRAHEFALGDKLVKQDGSFDPVVAIDQVDYFGKVYNLDTKDANPIRKILLANGYLNGSHWYQDLGQSMLNRLLLKGATARRLED